MTSDLSTRTVKRNRRRHLLETLESRNLLTGWHNADLPFDVDASESVTATDALLVINALNSGAARFLTDDLSLGQLPGYVDTNNNGMLSPVDALLVLNALNLRTQPANLVASIAPTDDPNSNDVVIRDQIRLEGQAIPGSRIRFEVAGLDALLNQVEAGKQSLQVTTSDDGKFSVDLTLFSGLNSITAHVRDPLGRTVSLQHEIMRADAVSDWNAAILNVVRDWTALSNDPYNGRIVPSKPPVVARNLAMIHTAMFEAMNAVEARYESYLHQSIPVQGEVSAEAAGIAAAYDVARKLYPQPRDQAVWDATLFETLATIPTSASKQAGIELGQLVATQILASRSNDGSAAAEVYSSRDEAGRWSRTAPDYLPPLLPQWGQVRPMAVPNIVDYTPAPPPELSSAEYGAAVDEVMRLGGVDSSERSAEQSEIALFWADGGGTATPPGHWNRIASQVSLASSETSLDRARTFSLLNLALADAGISAWNTKYLYDFWRPIDAIRKADIDGNEQTVQDAAWLPLLRTPPFPTYTSGHSTFSGAAAAVLTKLYGENYSFASRSDTHTGLTQRPVLQEFVRQFGGFWEAAEEAGQSRIYGGIHFQFDNTAGLASGQSIGIYVVENLLRLASK